MREEMTALLSSIAVGSIDRETRFYRAVFDTAHGRKGGEIRRALRTMMDSVNG